MDILCTLFLFIGVPNTLVSIPGILLVPYVGLSMEISWISSSIAIAVDHDCTAAVVAAATAVVLISYV